jgi:hypothetical protein
MLFSLQMRGNTRRAFKFYAVTLVIIDRERNQVVASLTRQSCHDHGIETAGQKDDCGFSVRCHAAPIDLRAAQCRDTAHAHIVSIHRMRPGRADVSRERKMVHPRGFEPLASAFGGHLMIKIIVINQ